MAREVLIVTTCDRCAAEGVKADGQTYRGLGAMGGTVEIDLCRACYDQTLGPVTAMLGELGRSPKESLRSSTKKETACPECSRTFDSIQGVTLHRRRAHGWVSQSKDAIYQRALKAERARAAQEGGSQ